MRRRGGQRARRARESDSSGAALSAEVQQKRGVAGHQGSSAGIRASADEVFKAIESLYFDELKPFGRILRKRVAERYLERQNLSSLSGDLPDVDIQHMKAMCEGNQQLDVRPEEGGDWSAIIKGRPEQFVDIYSSDDNFGEDTWCAANEYFADLSEDTLLPGGRYSCAQVLLQRQLPFFANFSLGKVCHFVQLAICKHKSLGYSNGAVVPYSRSQSRIKEQCAVSQLPCQSSAEATSTAASGDAGLSLATWEVARDCLREILANAAMDGSTEPSSVPLSNVKRLLRSKYKVELSETSLGYSKLSELLTDQRFGDICEVQLQHQGYIVVQAQPRQVEAETSVQNITIALSDIVNSLPNSPCKSPVRRSLFCPDEPLNLEDAGLVGSGYVGEPTPLRSPGATTPSTYNRWHFPSSAEQLRLEQRGETTVGNTQQHSLKVISLLQALDEQADAEQKDVQEAKVPLDQLQVPLLVCDSLEQESPPRKQLFCPDEPLHLDDAEIFDDPGPDCQGVKNTFIQMPTTPLFTPVPGSGRRSQSVPREVGSSSRRGRGRADEEEPAVSVVPSPAYPPAYLPPPTPCSPLLGRQGYMSELGQVLRLADFV